MSHALSPLEKAALLTGASTWESRAFPHAGIRALFLADGPHGVRKQVGSSDHLGINGSLPATCFPTSATVANSWDPALAQEVGEAIGAEAAAQGVDVLLGPGLNIKRNPLGGRSFEYFSEDPILAGQLAAAYVRGIQSQGVAACPKHFAVNSQELRRMASDSVLDERTLREIYLTAFEIVVREAAPLSIMSSYNKINGTYAHENAHLLTDILRDEWGFTGPVITDWGGGNDAPAAVRAGGGLEMPAPGLGSAREILEAIGSGDLDPDALDARAEELRALAAAIAPDGARAADLDEHHALARRAARESVVLLKNDDAILPLAPGTRVAVVGDFAFAPRYQGAGSSLVNPTRLTTGVDAWRDASEIEVVATAKGFARDGSDDAGLASEALAAAAQADVTVLYMGLDEVAESEGADREHLRLAANQVDLLAQLHAAGSRVVVVLSAGSVVEMPRIDHADAIVHGYLGGQAGAEAMVDILSGVAAPSGKLAESYPMTLADTPSAQYFPSTGDHAEYREGPFVGYRYYVSAGTAVRFPFGYGLTYTTFAYSDLKVTDMGARFTVENTGTAAGAEIAQLYVSRPAGGPLSPARELKGFAKVSLEPGERAQVTIPFDHFTFRRYDVESGAWVVDAGEYGIMVGAHSEDAALTASHAVKGTPMPAADPALATYAAAQIHDVSDEDFAALLGHAVPAPRAAGEPLGINDPLRAMHTAKSPVARLAARVFARLIARAERKGKPDLNLLFLYNMPFRAIGKMTMGAVSMPMVESIVDIVNGHFWRGTASTVRGFFRARKLNTTLERQLAARAQDAAENLARSGR